MNTPWFFCLLTELCISESYLYSLVCNSRNIPSGNICYPIDGEMSIFFQTDSNELSRRLQQGQQDISQLEENIRQIFSSGQLNDAHRAIISVESILIIIMPVTTGNGIPINKIGSSPSNWWIYILITAGIGLLIVLAILVWQKIKNKRNQQSDDLSAVAFFQEALPETI